MRLAFVVAAHLEPEILIVDEVLAVGDTQFQRKCLGKMSEVSQAGRTVLFVSHNMAAVSSLCKNSLMLAQGKLLAMDVTGNIIRQYLKSPTLSTAAQWVPKDHPAADAYFTRIEVRDNEGRLSQKIDYRYPFQIYLSFEVKKQIPSLSANFRLTNVDGIYVLFAWMLFRKSVAPGSYELTGPIPGAFLTPTTYHVHAALTEYERKHFHVVRDLLEFSVINTTTTYREGAAGWGLVHLEIPASLKMLEYSVGQEK